MYIYASSHSVLESHYYRLVFFFSAGGNEKGEDVVSIGNPSVSANSSTAKRKSQVRDNTVAIGTPRKKEDENPIARRLML